ncbi:Ff.00g086590.m01.CDS01 [Fusarium sp. VM40]|nr:Ff.00g086590.m01.CDS01 [Fusarium sp. VM40]
MSVSYLSTELHSEHTHWQCILRSEANASSTCDAITVMDQIVCSGCAAPERALMTKAIATNGDEIGFLAAVDSDGTETWKYYYQTNGVRS